MAKLRYLIIIIIIAMVAYLSWAMSKTKPLDHIPEKAKLVMANSKNNLTGVNHMKSNDYYRVNKNFLNMEQEGETEIRSDIEEKISRNIFQKHD